MRTLKYIAAIALLLTVSLASFAQHRIAGFVKDSLSREVLVGAHIIDSTSMRVVPTDNTGYLRDRESVV